MRSRYDDRRKSPAPVERRTPSVSVKPTPIINLVRRLIEQSRLDKSRTPKEGELSERELALALKVTGESSEEQVQATGKDETKRQPGEISPSHFTRILNGAGEFDPITIRLLGVYAGKSFEKYSGTKYQHEPHNVVQSVQAEYSLWRTSLNALSGPPESVEVRTPVARRAPFRKAAAAILFEDSLIVVIQRDTKAENTVGVSLSRSAFALSVAQYCSCDAPDNFRRTLQSVSLAELKGPSITATAIARRVYATLNMPRRTGKADNTNQDIYQAIADSLRYVTRPLLFLSEGRDVPAVQMAIFLRSLAEALPPDSNVKILVTGEGILDDGKALESAISVSRIELNVLEPSEMARHIAWKANLSADEAEMISFRFQHLGDQMGHQLRTPNIASVLAGNHLSALFSREKTPWKWLADQTVSDDVEEADDVKAEGYDALLDLIKHPVASDVIIAAMGKLQMRERAFLLRLAIFSGSFSEAAARALYFTNTGDTDFQDSQTGLTSRTFYQDLDRLCLAGFINYESVSTPLFFGLQAEVRNALRLQSAALRDALRARWEAKLLYFAFLNQEAQTALDYFDKDPHTVDTGGRKTFARLEAEWANIDFFLNEIWDLLKSPDGDDGPGLPLPEVWSNRDSSDRIDNIIAVAESFPVWSHLSEPERRIKVRELRKKLFLVRLVANLALFWEARNLPGTAIRHLRAAANLVENDILKAVEGLPRIERELYAIRAQLLLTNLHIEVRLQRNELPPEELTKREKEAENCLKLSYDNKKENGYEYGRALLFLIRGIRESWENPQAVDACDTLDNAIREAANLAGSYEEDADLRGMLQMARDRRPVARYLTFMAVGEKARAQLRRGKVHDSLQTGEALLQAAMLIREPRIIAEALLSRLHTLFTLFALGPERPFQPLERPFSDEQSQQLRDLLFQMAAFIGDLPTDKSTLRGHYVTMTAIHNLEKALATYMYADEQDKKDWWPPYVRLRYAEQLFSLGISSVRDNHYVVVYHLFAASTYLRFYQSGGRFHSEKSETEKTSENDAGAGEAATEISVLHLAASYGVRSLYGILAEYKNGYMPSVMLRAFYKQFWDGLGESVIATASALYATAAGINDNTEEIIKFLREMN